MSELTRARGRAHPAAAAANPTDAIQQFARSIRFHPTKIAELAEYLQAHNGSWDDPKDFDYIYSLPPFAEPHVRLAERLAGPRPPCWGRHTTDDECADCADCIAWDDAVEANKRHIYDAVHSRLMAAIREEK